MKESIYPELNDEQWLRERFVDQRMSPTKIAEELGVHRTSVHRSLKRLGLYESGRNRSKYPELDSKEWIIEQLKTKTIAQIGRDIGSTPGNVADRIRRYGIPFSTSKSEAIKKSLKITYPDGRFGKNHPRWKGGRNLTDSGHVYIYKPEHPDANHQGYVLEHRLVAEQKAKRRLLSTEVVHHIDLDKLNNVSDNLELCKNHSAHRSVHAQLEKVATQLIRRGHIKFKDGEYYLDESMLK